jgi:chemotaxis protein CheX
MIGPDAVAQYTADVWGAVLGMEAWPADRPPPAAGRPTLTGCVHIAGGWQGVVMLVCPADLADRAAAAVFAVPPADLAPDLVHDAVGELTNMIGGNLKALLPPPAFLSLPTVTRGTDYTVHVPGTRTVIEQAFDCEGRSFLVAVRADDRRPAEA